MKYYFIILNLFFYSYIHSQSIDSDVVSASGQTFINNDVQLSFTVGELVINTEERENIVLTQGIHQSSLIVTKLDALVDIDFDIKIYPNPVISRLNIDISKSELSLLQYKLFDMNGVLITSDIIHHQNSTIDFLNYKAGIYILSIYNEEGDILESYKLQVN